MKVTQARTLMAILLLSLIMISLTPSATAQEEPVLRVVASISPLAGIADEIGGNKVETLALLPEGFEPHVFQVTTEILDAANSADLLILTGHFDWETELADQTGKPYITLEDFEEFGAELSPMPGEESNYATAQEHEHDDNPHAYWLLPKNAIAIANATRDSLTVLSPTYSDYWQDMFNGFLHDVQGLLNLISELDDVHGFSELQVVVTFPAEAYVAEAFGIDVVAVLHKGENIFISGGELLEVSSALMNGSIDLIFASDISRLQAGGEFAIQLSQDTGSKLVWLRAVFFTGFSDYVATMTYNLGALNNGLEGTAPESVDGSLNLFLVLLAGILGILALAEGLVLVQRAKMDK